MALKSDGVPECREISHQPVRAGLAMTEFKNEDLVDCSFAIKPGPLKSINCPFLDIEASRPFQPAFIWPLVRQWRGNSPRQRGVKERGSKASTTSELHHVHSRVLKHKRNTAKGPPLA